jgi:hypothetical protein
VAILEYRSKALKVIVKDGEVHVVSATHGGQTVRMIYDEAQCRVLAVGMFERLQEEKPVE